MQCSHLVLPELKEFSVALTLEQVVLGEEVLTIVYSFGGSFIYIFSIYIFFCPVR